MDFDIKSASYETTYLIPYRSAVLLRPVLAVVLDQPVVQCVDPCHLIKVKKNLSSCSTSLIKIKVKTIRSSDACLPFPPSPAAASAGWIIWITVEGLLLDPLSVFLGEHAEEGGSIGKCQI